MSKKVLLMILDGWGIATNKEVSAIDHANTPYVDGLYTKYSHSKLKACGEAVGLPEGQMGNSEVGHMNIGAGRIVYQMLEKINITVRDKSIYKNEALVEAFEYAKANNKKVHFTGLVSDGGVHSHILHLKGLLSAASEAGLKDVFVHAFTDGRDCSPNGGKAFIEEIEKHAAETTGQVASITGRYFAMDRDKRWARVKLAYDAMVKGEGEVKTTDLSAAMQASYDAGVTDEFIKPTIKVDGNGEPIATIEEGDVVVCFNFRTDRGRQITVALTQEDFPEEDMKKLDLYYVTMTQYDETFKGVKVMFDNKNIENTLGEVLEANGKKQIRIAETEKYPHVTFFFSGGREEPFEGETRLMCPSPKVATYDLQPEMSAGDIRDKIIPELKKGEVDFVCLNFANPDMVGHTGVFEAAVKACETVDSCAGAVIDVAKENGYSVIVIADHGNSDIMSNPDGSPHTAHTLNLVPCILVDDEYKKPIKDGKLGDLAPTILELMEVEKPADMTGESLLS
ncbi:2,3-bisphosphoglycerate-independent phosphoglycerate mutase [Flammeovirgaceae bacterium SG7u.111]|nr:2,3-bisphosphoglycerate-independent phosphoglycerate mutase [Flammeovirgaceae bacterium SG7u.132]WPO35431.1 2,3-bisphosphoglycerate-independent phosphoglycerate mutase [Flammeovirgaceae bacterium SG7u.111]